MLINEACSQCGLTKKAAEYYIAQGLLSPAVLENGYRDFSQGDVERLKRISVLRRLGLAVADIRKVLDAPGGMALYRVSQSQDLALEDLRSRQELLLKLAQDGNWDSVRMQLETLEKKKTVLQKMLDRFPGFYGKYLVYHFAPYLNEPITTAEQQEAFETIVDYLDSVDLVLPEDLQEYVDEATKNLDTRLLGEVTANLEKAIQDPEQYIANHKEALSRYALLKKTAAFQQTPAYRLQECLKTLLEENGYDTVFLPALRRLSTAYRKYQDALEKADTVFRKEMED